MEVATQQYDRGLTQFLNVLDAQRQLYDLQDQQAITQENVVIEFIMLYKSLGGGWQNYQSTPAIRQPRPAVIAAAATLVAAAEQVINCSVIKK